MFFEMIVVLVFYDLVWLFFFWQMVVELCVYGNLGWVIEYIGLIVIWGMSVKLVIDVVVGIVDDVDFVVYCVGLEVVGWWVGSVVCVYWVMIFVEDGEWMCIVYFFEIVFWDWVNQWILCDWLWMYFEDVELYECVKYVVVMVVQ